MEAVGWSFPKEIRNEQVMFESSVDIRSYQRED